MPTESAPVARLALAGVLAATAAGLGACRATAGGAAAPSTSPVLETDTAAIEVTLVDLYDAFCFDPGEPADWDGMRALFAPGATFFAPIRAGRTPNGQDADAFVDGFRAWIETAPVGQSGLHELITHWRIERCGTIAHAFVTFEGVIPTSGEPYSLGVDSLQLVQDGERWLVASFTSQYARPDAHLPARFSDPSTIRR